MTAAIDRPMSADDILAEGARRHRAGDYEGAEAHYCTVLKNDPTHADALYLASMLAYTRGFHTVAYELASQSIAQNEYFAPAHGALGLAQINLGERSAGIASLRRALLLAPGYKEVRDNLIFALDADPYTTRAESLHERRDYDRLLVKPRVDAAPPHTNDRTPDRRLRVGYLSNDFKHHSAANASLPIIEHHDPERFEVHLFSTIGRPDAVSERFKVPGTVWHGVGHLNDDEIAQEIRDAGIDVLVDLAGYSGHNRLLVLARRPAPVQVLAWGYPADTSGLSCYDAIFADAVTVPPGAEKDFSEPHVVRLPALMPYRPLVDAPDVAPPPCREKGYVQFGYLGRAHKVSEPCLVVWAEILRRVPGSRILFKSGQFHDVISENAVADVLVAHGVTDDRIEIRGHTGQREHLATHAEVDICLDPIPQSGGMTATESIFMGVPLVTLPGHSISHRTAASIMTVAFGEELARCYIARSRKQYVERAVMMARQVTTWTLRDRQGYRGLLESSVMMDYPAYTRSAEDAYRHLWEEWCKR